jgi:hypothetical protein
VTGGGAIGALIGAVKATVYRYVIESGRITAREVNRGRPSVDLTRLTSATVPSRLRRFPWRLVPESRFLVLRDDRGATVQLNFSGTRPGPRRRLLAAIEPYAMAGGVSRTGLVHEALDGQLWWPRPR